MRKRRLSTPARIAKVRLGARSEVDWCGAVGRERPSPDRSFHLGGSEFAIKQVPTRPCYDRRTRVLGRRELTDLRTANLLGNGGLWPPQGPGSASRAVGHIAQHECIMIRYNEELNSWSMNVKISLEAKYDSAVDESRFSELRSGAQRVRNYVQSTGPACRNLGGT